MKNGWTYRQYAIYRFCFGIYLFVHFFGLLLWGKELFSNNGMLANKFLSPLMPLFPNVFLIQDSPIMVTILISFGIICSALFAIGKWDRISALVLWYLLTCLLDRNPFITNPSLPYIGWLLLAHVCLPSKALGPFDWKMPPPIFLVAWIVMALGYSYSGYTKLESPSWINGTAILHTLQNPLARTNFFVDLILSSPDFIIKCLTWSTLILELLFAPLSVFSRVRPWIWLILLLMHTGLMMLIRFADLSFGMIILHLFTFDPHWLKPKQSSQSIIVFYDGACGLCHSFVQFVLSEMPQNALIRFAPLKGEIFQKCIIHPQIDDLPDSIILYLSDEKRVLSKADAVAFILDQLGGIWRVLGFVLKMIPAAIRNAGYDLVARARHMIFSKPKRNCPLLPKSLQAHILAD